MRFTALLDTSRKTIYSLLRGRVWAGEGEWVDYREGWLLIKHSLSVKHFPSITTAAKRRREENKDNNIIKRP